MDGAAVEKITPSGNFSRKSSVFLFFFCVDVPRSPRQILKNLRFKVKTTSSRPPFFSPFSPNPPNFLFPDFFIIAEKRLWRVFLNRPFFLF
jgi:hypothetical protein